MPYPETYYELSLFYTPFGGGPLQYVKANWTEEMVTDHSAFIIERMARALNSVTGTWYGVWAMGMDTKHA